MKKIYFTVSGTDYRQGSGFIRRGDVVYLEKEPDNNFDSEAIKVTMKGIGQIGYVANSVRTVIGESMSAGRIYDKIGKKAKGKVCYVLPEGVICKLDKKSIVGPEILAIEEAVTDEK